MNGDSRDALDRLLGEWATSCKADDVHTRGLADQILSAARDEGRQAPTDSAADASPFADRPVPASIHAESIQADSKPAADWTTKLMLGGGGLLMILVLAGCLLCYNLANPARNPQQPRPIAAPNGGTPPTATDASSYPTAASLGANVLAAKRQLLTATNAIFDDQLAWIADGQREVSFEVRDQAALDNGEFMLVRVVVAQRASPDLPWLTVWQTDVISRNEELVEVAPKRLAGCSIALWTHLMPDGEVAVDMDLKLDQQTQEQFSSGTVLQSGQPRRVACSTEQGVERCVFQTVMPLSRS